MKKLFLKSLAIGLMALLPAMSWAGEKLVNNGSYTNTYVPIYGTYASNYTRVQWIQPSSDLTALKDSDITAMTFHASTTTGSWGNAEWDVYVFETTSTSVSSGYLSTASAAKVYSGKLSVSSSKMNIVFDDSYTYKGGNLVVDLSQKTKGSSSSVYFYYQSGSYGASRYGYNNSSLASVSGSSSYNRPKMTISYEPTPTCKKTKNIIVEDLTSTSATIKWNKVADAVSYDVTVGTNEFLGLTDTVQAVSGLDPNTEYTVSVVTNCSGEDKSGAKSSSFTTACGAMVTPFTEGFEKYDAGQLPGCWEKPGTGTVAVIASNAKTGTKSLKFSGSTSNVVVLPVTDKEVNLLQITFWSRPESANANCGTFSVGYVTDASDATTFVPVDTYSYTDGTTMKEKNAILTAAKTGARIAFRHNAGSASYYWFIDDITVSDAPTCIYPTNVKVTPSVTTANVIWNAGSTETQYQYVCVEKGVTPNWESVAPISVKNASLSGLTASTDYDLYVRSYCSASDQSTPVKVSFTTECAAKDVPYTNGFETGTFPDCWVKPNSGTVECSTSNPKSGTKSLKFSGSTSNLVVLPIMNVATNLLRVSFWSRPESTNSNCGTFSVGYVTNAYEDSTFVEVEKCTTSDGASMIQKVVALSSAPENARIAFRHNSVLTTYYWFIDDVEVSLIPNCTKPNEVSVTDVQTNSAVISWTAGGDETAWNLQYRKVGASTWTAATGTITSPYTLSGLNMGATYEVQVQAACSATNLSDWTDANSFTTECAAMTLGTIYDFESDATGSLPACWNGGWKNTSYYSLYDSYGENPSIVSGAIYNHTQGGSKAAKMKLYSSYIKSWIALPKLPDGVNLTDLQVSAFAYSSDGYNQKMLEVGVMSDPTDYSKFQSAGYIICESTNSGDIKVVDFKDMGTYNNNYRYIAFRAVGSVSGSKYVYLDDIQVAPKPKAPFNLRAVDVAKDTAVVKFAQEDSKGKWNMQVATDKDFAKSVVDTVITDSTAVLKDLNGSTNYFVRVQHVDEAYNVTSAWVSASFTTECEAKTTPYSEDFTGTSVPACWTAVSESANFPSVSSNKLYMGPAGAAFLPELNFTGIEGIENAMISFEASAGSKEIKVILVADPKQLSFADLANQTVIGTATLGTDAKYYEFFVSDVPAADRAGKNYIGLYAAEASYISLDNLNVKAAANRLPEFGTEVVTASTATIPFTQKNDDEGGWTVQYGTDKTFATKTQIDLNPEATKEIALTGLTENTTYYVRIQQAMDEDATHWAVMSLTTECGKTKLNTIYGFENFNSTSTKSYTAGSASYFSSCWTRGNKYDYNNNYMPYAYSGDKYAGNNSMIMWGGSSSASYFAMPAFAETQVMTDLIVTFYAKADNVNYKKLQVGATTGITAVNTPNFTNDSTVNLTTDWAKYEVKFEDYAGSGQLIMFYYADGSNSMACYIDNIEIKLNPCKNAKPSITSTATDTAVLASGLTSGADWAWKFEGGEENKVDGINASTTITGLIADTEYTVLVQAQCSATEKSEWKSVTFRTRCESVLALGYTEDFSNGIPTCMDTIGAKSKNQQAELAQETALILPIFSSTDYSTLKLTFKASTNNDASPNVYIIAYEEGVALASQVSLDTIVLEEQMKSKTVYLNEIADINTKLAGKRIGFYRSTGAAINIDDVAIVVASNFKAPENLSKVVDSETAEGANFTFEQPGDVKNVWVYEVFADEDLTQLAQRDTINVLSFTLTGLNMKTNYYVQVKQMDGEASSDFSNVVKFTTECGKYANGMSQIDNLESYSGNTSESYVYNNVPSCWTIGQDCNSYSSAPAGIYKNSTYAKSENNAISLTSYKSGYTYYFTWIALPEIDTDDMSLISLKFAARTYSGTEELEIGVMGDPTVKNSYEKIGSVKPTNAYGNYTILFNNYTGDKKYIVFVSNKKSTKFYIDDIKVSESACAMAKDAAASEITDVSAKLTIANATPDWNVVVKDGAKVAFSQNDITDANVVATGLSAQTDYVAYITMNCQGGGVSDTVEVAFTTACGLLTSADMPYQYGFEKGLSDCWTKFGTYPSLQSTPNTGSKSAEMYSSSTTSPNVYVSPEFDINSISLAAYKVSFYARLYGSYSNVGEMRIALASEVPATAADALNLPVAGTITTINSATYSKFEVSLDTVSSIDFTDKKYIVFCLLKSDIYLDDIEFSLLPCVKAQGAAASDVTASSATISITTATPDWNVVVKDGQTEVFSQDDIKTASVNVTGLSEETTYEAIITMNCAGGVVSDPDTIEFTTTATVWELVRDNLSQDQIGTTCLGKNITNVRGGVLYGVNYGTTKSIEFAEKQLPIAAGDPLLFQADGTNGGKLEVVYGSATATEALKDQGKDGVNGFVGLISGASVAIEEGNILVSGGKLHLTGTGCNLTAGHAYIKASELPTQSPAPVQGRRLVLTQNGTAVATGTDEVMINNLEGVQKIVRDGQLIIIRGGQLFNAQGQKL